MHIMILIQYVPERTNYVFRTFILTFQIKMVLDESTKLYLPRFPAGYIR